ncbi:DNA ligase 4 isoform X2 [Nomia melanderi]|uniref:DNA ligase 4 isoform X2 n=1 Tax=Nomia melanderi TaxID=2448451 RepID=UPI0013046D1F|nr:DNA ligase 4 [Nomia melanderi]XP_031843345.1 DNA ligase 4 [Nomia melanderi]XP_031843346.1 DNA ligase 4 [Nomia melanderi]
MNTTLAEKIKFKELCNILEEVSKAHTTKKAEILERFMQRCRFISQELKIQCPDADISIFPLLRLILPDLERERGPNKLKEKSLADLYIRVFCLGKGQEAIKLMQYKVPRIEKNPGRDFAEKASWILRNHLRREASGITIKEINLFLDDISSRTENNQRKDETFKILLGKIDALEFKWITRIILKDLKCGVRTKRILQVIHPDANSLFDVSSDLRQVCDTLYHPHTGYHPQLRHHHDIKVFSHFKPMLLEKCKIEDIKKLFVSGEKYFVQCKYDGERSQMHMKNGRYKYFTRQGYDITNNPGYGENSSSGFMSSVFSRLLNPLCTSIILDGELMGWHKEKKLMGSKGMNFDVKKLSNNSHHQPCFIAFDIIMYNDTLVVNEPYVKRLKILKDAIKEEVGSLMLCEINEVSTSEDVCRLFNTSMENKEEGLVVKKCDNKYKPNVRDGSGCYKIKAEYSDGLVNDVDLIILGGYYGEGKFMNLIKSFLVGVVSPPNIPGENPTKFLSVVSVSNGFSMETLKDLWKKFEKKWKKKCPGNVIPPRREPPDLWICPEDSIIITVRATELTRSNNYQTGYSLRFPKVIKIRYDKPWYSTCTTTELLSFVKDSRPIHKLTKRNVDHDDIEEVPEVKMHRPAKPRFPVLDNKPSRLNIYENHPVYLTRLLDGRKICVINGDNELPKEHIEKVLMQHRATLVKNPLNDNYCIIVGNVKTARAQSIIQREEYDVVTLEWFKRVVKEENWSSLEDFFPWEIISCRESTKCRLACYYDDYYDNYFADATEESLIRSLEKAGEEAKTIELSLGEMKKLDRKLFDHGISPYSIFREIAGYFDNPSDTSKYAFRFMAGIVKEIIDDSVTHVFTDGNSLSSELKNSMDNKLQRLPTIVKSEWIRACFIQNELIPVNEYLIE